MKTLLELEKEIPATVLATGYVFIRDRNQTQFPIELLRAVYAVMKYEEQLLTSPRIDHPVPGQ